MTTTVVTSSSFETGHLSEGLLVQISQESNSPHRGKMVRVSVLPKENGGLPFLRENNSVIVKDTGENHTYYIVEISDLLLVEQE